MKFGIIKFENFNPIYDIDLSQATITIDAKFTNLAMMNYEPSSWDGIHKALRSIPLHHPLWRPDPKLGDSPWIASGSAEVATSMPNVRFELDLPLLPLELWVPDDDTMDRSHCPISCPNCLATFDSIGALINHSRIRVCLDHPSVDVDDDSDFDQDAIDGYWTDLPFKCDFEGCPWAFKLNGQLSEHMLVHSDARPFKCTVTGCHSAFKRKADLKGHMRTHSDIRSFKCTAAGCSKAFKTRQELTRHTNRVHSDHRPFKCSAAGCSRAFKIKDELKVHMLEHSDNPKPHKCDFAGCSAAFSRLSTLNHHKKKVHGLR